MENNESKTPKKTTAEKSATKTAEKKPATASSSKPATKTTTASTAAKTTATTPETASKAAPKATVSKTATPSSSAKPTSSTTKPAAATSAKSTNNTSSAPKPVSSTITKTSVDASKKPGDKPQVKEINKNHINKDLVAEDNVEEKKKKKKFLLIILFIILGIALIGLAIYFIVSIPKSEINFKVEIDAEVTTTFENEHGQIEYYKYIPGDLIDGKLIIRIDDLNSTVPTSDSVFLRFKISVEVDNNYYSGLFYPIFNKESDWYGNAAGAGEESADNYYYYCLRCYDNTEISVFDTLDFYGEGNNNVLNGKEGTIIFTVEILEGNFSAISQEWHTAPDAWRGMVR